jgi:hypothetical protein
MPYTPPIPEDTKGPPKQENHAPVLHKIGDKIVQVGQTIEIVPLASDQDGDKLLYSLYGDLPEGAAFSKSPPRFSWTPQVAGLTVSLTFLVSDSKDSDSESVDITVVSENSNHPPLFQQVGDQVIEVDTYHSLTLQASDLDGDTLIFNVEGPLPEGATLNGNIFEWHPQSGTEGLKITVRFTVTDGQAKDLLDVNYFVVAPGQNKAPTFVPIGPQIAVVGEAYSLTLYAVDPEGDDLTFEMVSEAPEGSAFDAEKHLFQWVPVASQGGKVHSLIFKVSDANYSTLFDVDINVKSSAVTPGECTNDSFEPNNTAQTAAGVTVGVYENLSICDTELSPIDEDWFLVPLTVGQTLSVQTTFIHAWGDIDIAIYSPNDTAIPVAKGDSATDNELLTFKIPYDGNWLFRVFGVGQTIFTNTYTLEVSTTGLGCEEDDYEENDNFSNAAPLEQNSYLDDVQYCPGDPDVFKLNIKCGQSLDAAISFNSVDGDLDLALFRESNTLSPFSESKTKTGTETVDYHNSPLDETLFLKVTAYPPESTVVAYTLSSQVTGAAECIQDEFEPNDVKNKATFATPPMDQFSDLTLCCNEDWFYIPLKIGDQLSGDITFGTIGVVKARVLSPDTKKVLAESEPSNTGVTVVLPSATIIGNHYLVVEGDPGINYKLQMTVKSNDGCKSSKGCSQGTICEKVTGTCWDEQCETKDSCPSGQFMPCLDGFCMDGCTYDADCRLSYTCKGFEEGHYCGVPGNKPTGSACLLFNECKGSGSCYYKAQGGYCTRVGCTANSQCMSDASCVQHGNINLCGKKCNSNEDCRQDEGYTCKPKPLPNGVPTQVCLPAL